METESEVPIYVDLIGLDQDDPKLVNAIFDKVLWRPSYPKQPLNLKARLNSVINGQFGQPKFAENVLRKNGLFRKQNGFFIEAGAGGGELFSNSLHFEVNFNWTGLLGKFRPTSYSYEIFFQKKNIFAVEPNPDWWVELKSKNRNAWILPHCLSTSRKVEIVEFDVSKFIGGIINPDNVKKPSDLSREIPVQPYERTIKVCKSTLGMDWALS